MPCWLCGRGQRFLVTYLPACAPLHARRNSLSAILLRQEVHPVGGTIRHASILLAFNVQTSGIEVILGDMGLTGTLSDTKETFHGGSDHKIFGGRPLE